MTPTRIAASVLVVLAVGIATACGSDKQSVPSDAVAVVDGTPITKASLNDLLARAKKTYLTQKRDFPKAGTAEYQALQTQAVAFLVQRAEYANRASELDLEVTDKEITDRIEQVKEQSFGGSQAKLDEQLKAQGYTAASLRSDIESQLLSEKIYASVTKDAKVAPEEIKKYYEQNKAQYTTAESRDVRHILVKTRKLADQIEAELKAGADFAALAKKHSTDPGSKDNGGKLTIVRGQTVAPFDTSAFLLRKNQVSAPIKTQFGFHVIEPLSAVRPPKVTTLKEATPQIQAQLLDKAKNDEITKWTADTKTFFAKKVTYATGYEPPEAATSAATTTG